MNKAAKTLILTAAAIVAATAPAQTEEKKFVACPIVRDTDPPCWLVDYDGKRYYLGIQQDLNIPVRFYPPQLRHRILVEGRVKEGPEICGGIPLELDALSVLPDVDPSCDQMIPAENMEPPPSRRKSAPYPNGVRLATVKAESKYSFGLTGKPPAAEPPFEARTFTVLFTFDSDYLHMEDAWIIRDAMWYAQDSKAPRVEVRGYRGAVKLDDGTIAVEQEHMAERRAEKARTVLVGLGFPEDRLDVRWDGSLKATKKLPSHEMRRVVIRVIPE